MPGPYFNPCIIKKGFNLIKVLKKRSTFLKRSKYFIQGCELLFLLCYVYIVLHFYFILDIYFATLDFH